MMRECTLRQILLTDSPVKQPLHKILHRYLLEGDNHELSLLLSISEYVYHVRWIDVIQEVG